MAWDATSFICCQSNSPFDLLVMYPLLCRRLAALPEEGEQFGIHLVFQS
jgi:hypothetical protein